MPHVHTMRIMHILMRFRKWEEQEAEEQSELKSSCARSNHKGYKAYKVLEGEYDFARTASVLITCRAIRLQRHRVCVLYKNEIPVKFLTGHTEGLPQKMQAAAQAAWKFIPCL